MEGPGFDSHHPGRPPTYVSVARDRAAGATATALGAVAAVGAATFAWGSLVERNRFTVRHEVLPILQPGAAPLRILQFADAHMAPWQVAKQDWMRSLVELQPDLVINTGDNLGHVDGLEGIRRGLEPFAGIPGAYVNGSNDYFGPVFKSPLSYFSPNKKREYKPANLDTDALESFFQDDLGWISLNNVAGELSIGDTRVELFGVNDAHRRWDRLDLLPGEIDELRENEEPDDPSSVTLGVTHAPYRRVLDAFVTYGASAIFAGHTHGGQVRIPGLPALVTNCDIPRDQAQGLSTWSHAGRSAWLNVSAGIGTSIYAPVRFACPPEAVLVTLIGTEQTVDDIGYS
jgi:predicted MPP superfamily phosphohydrolase